MGYYGSIEYRAGHYHFGSKSSNQRHMRTCRYCEEKGTSFEVALPIFDYYDPTKYQEWANLSVAERTRIRQEHGAQEKAVILAECVPHLVKEHGFTVCTKCDSLVKKSGLSSHKKSYSCAEASRQRVMHDRGMLDVTGAATVFLKDMDKLAAQLKRNLDWEDYETADMIDDECVKAKREFSKVGGIARVRTTYISGEGWEERLWAPETVAFYMKALIKRFPNGDTQDHERLRDLWQFLESDDLQRECAVGLLDLAMDQE